MKVGLRKVDQTVVRISKAKKDFWFLFLYEVVGLEVFEYTMLPMLERAQEQKQRSFSWWRFELPVISISTDQGGIIHKVVVPGVIRRSSDNGRRQ